MVDSDLNDLQLKYQPLMTFQGTYEGVLNMPQAPAGNPRVIISVSQGDPFAAILSRVSGTVLQTYGQQVWKGITGPEQSPNYSDYWLWVEPGFHGVLEMGQRYNFQITQCTPFACGGDVFSYAVNIKVSVVQPV